jgi:hypothetical protein
MVCVISLVDRPESGDSREPQTAQSSPRSAPLRGAATSLASQDLRKTETIESANIAASGDGRTPLTIIATAAEVREQYKKVKRLEEFPVEKRGWMLEVLNVVRQLGKTEFTNQDVYAFEHHFKELHPNNHFIRDKIRQKLQDLARAGFLDHAGRNDYRLK